MKLFTTRFFAVSSAVLLCMGLMACGKTSPSATVPAAPAETHTKIEHTESNDLAPLRELVDSSDPNFEGEITEWNFQNNFSGISTKTHTGESADVLTRLISSLKDTEEVVPAVCDVPWNPDGDDFPPEEVEVGTCWYQIGSALYRKTYDRNADGDNWIPSLARVTSHFGEGVVLETTDEFWRVFELISANHPRASYIGNYADGILNITHIYPGEDDITITVKDLEFGTKNLEKRLGNKITVEITAPTDREVAIAVNSCHSADLLGSQDSKTVALKAGEPQTVTLTFDGWDEWVYTVDISAQNTSFTIYFNRS